MSRISEPIPRPEFSWFHLSAEVNDPLCLCSVCLLPITAREGDDAEEEEDDPFPDTDPDRVPLRLWSESGYEARFHQACVPRSVIAGLSTMARMRRG